MATAPIRHLAWESPHAVGAALEKAKRQKKKKRCASDLVLLVWLWHRPAAAAPIQPLAQELIYAANMALKRKKKKKKRRRSKLTY